MQFSLAYAQIKKLAGLSSRNGIWLTDGVVEIGAKEMAFFKHHIGVILGAVFASVGGLNFLLYEWWIETFFARTADMFQLILFAIHIVSFDLFVGMLIFLVCSTVFMGKQTKKFHALEHKILNLLRFNKSITVKNLKKSSPIYDYCGVNILSLYAVGTAFMCVFTLVVNSGLRGISTLTFSISLVIFLFLFCVLLFEYSRAIFGKFFQKLLFTAKISHEEITYGLHICRDFVKKQYMLQTQQKIEKLKQLNGIAEQVVTLEP